MAASLKLLPGSTVRWRGRRYLIVDYESLDAIIARQPGKRRLERIPVNEAAPDHASHIVSAWTPDLASVPEEAWQKAVKRFKILKPLLFEDAASVCVEHIMVLAPKERLSEPRGWAVIKPDDLRRRSIRYARADRHPGTHQLRKQLGPLADHNRVREIKEPRGRSRSQSYSQIALLHSHLFLHDQLTFADISGTDIKQRLKQAGLPAHYSPHSFRATGD